MGSGDKPCFGGRLGFLATCRWEDCDRVIAELMAERRGCPIDKLQTLRADLAAEHENYQPD